MAGPGDNLIYPQVPTADGELAGGISPSETMRVEDEVFDNFQAGASVADLEAITQIDSMMHEKSFTPRL